MTRTTAVTTITNRLGQRTGIDSLVITELQNAQAKLEGDENLPWFLTKFGTLSTVASQNYVNLPSDFLREKDDIQVFIDTDEVVKDEYGFLKKKYSESNNGQPEAYAIVGTKMYLFPTPDAVYSISFPYAGADTVLSTDIENNWLKYAPDLLIYTAGIVVAGFLRDPNAVGIFSSMLQQAVDSAQHDDVARAVANRDLTMGG